MLLAQYKRSVYKTLSIKPAKDGLRKVARKTPTTNLAHAIVGLKSETGELLQGMEQYILGFPLDDAMKQNAREELGDIVYYTTVLCKTLRIKMPASTKKVALKGTLTKALLQLDGIATDLLDQYKKSFYGRDLDMEKIATIAQPLPHLLYAINYTLFHDPIATTMDGNIAKLSHRYPEGFFNDAAQHGRNKVNELEAMENAVKDVVAE